MFAGVRRYRCDPRKVDDLLRIIDAEFVPRVGDRPGFRAFQVIDCGGGEVMTLSFFDGPEEAVASIALASLFIAERLADFGLERIDATVGAVRLRVAVPKLLEPAHA